MREEGAGRQAACHGGGLMLCCPSTPTQQPMHAAWQLARFDAANATRCLELFRSNRIFGLIIASGLILDSLLI